MVPSATQQSASHNDTIRPFRNTIVKQVSGKSLNPPIRPYFQLFSQNTQNWVLTPPGCSDTFFGITHPGSDMCILRVVKARRTRVHTGQHYVGIPEKIYAIANDNKG